jgi:Sigma-70, region 4
MAGLPRNFNLAPIDGETGSGIIVNAVKPSPPIHDLCAVRTQEEVALIMGISRARVCQHERMAMRRLRKWLEPYHPTRGRGAAVVDSRIQRLRERERIPGFAALGWWRVTKLVGNGDFPPATVCFAFNELRLLHEDDYRPPIVVGNRIGYVSAATMDQDYLSVRIWLAGSLRNLNRTGGGLVTLELEIIYGVPVIAAGVVE